MNPKYIYWQCRLWDWFAKSIPFIMIIVGSIFYNIGIRDWDLVKDILLVFSGLAFVTWWFWVLYTIMTILHFLESSKEGLKDVMEEIRHMYRDINEIHKRDR